MSDPIALKAIEDALKAHEGKLEGLFKKYSEEVAVAGAAANETRAELKTFAEEHKKLAARLLELEQKGVPTRPGTAERKSIGEQIVDDAAFKTFAEGKDKRFRLQLKNTILGQNDNQTPSDTLVPADRLQGIVPGGFRPLRVMDTIPMGSTASNNVEFTRELLFTNAAAEISEGEVKPEATLTFELGNAPVRTIAHWLKVSKQILRDAPALSSYIDRRLRYGVELRAEQQILNGNGTAPNISGILDSGNFTSYTPASDDTALDTLNKAKYEVVAADFVPDLIYMNPSDWGQIERLKRTDNGYVAGDGVALSYIMNGMQPMVWGLPVVATNSMPEGQFICMSSMAVQAFLRAGTTVEMFPQDSDNAVRNLVTILAEIELAFAVLRPAAIIAGSLTLG